ncbi:MAG TPA: hypothetical protein VHW90_11345 [Stellaceae bacterium]|jgi:hypothetical protein|nr:hypothetical protein [Stellaceae bacterium]
MQTAATKPGEASIGTPETRALHESFLAYGQFRYMKMAGLLAVASIVIYALDRPYGTGYGGSWAGYTLGTIGALLIAWLTWFGYSKRRYSAIRGRLAARLSAHVYLGLSLLFVATLHTGFHFGVNIHTLAYALMCLVIGTGIFGAFSYDRYPRLITENRSGMTMQQMLGRVASLDDELRHVAMPLDEDTAAIIQHVIDTTVIGGSVMSQLRGRVANCTSTAALAHVDAKAADIAPEMQEAWLRLRVLLDEKVLLLVRLRRDISYKAVMDLWLYFHVPLSFMLLAALIAHIVSVFFLW